jgi:L,D-peptidoglycan transpeptidase YkuD (ErfK/YbiS/YcfS/YnhG family)
VTTVRPLTLAVALLLGLSLLAGPASAPAAAAPRLPDLIGLHPAVKQLVTVTNRRWSDPTATLRVWRRRGESWRLVRGPVRASLGWNGFVPARKRRQSTGTTPAGRFTMRSAFGLRPDPGARLPYRHVDGNDVWPYEPRDPATYNIWQPHKASGTRWRADYAERLADYPVEYRYSIVLGFNLPRGVHWSRARKQYVARRPADTRRGGGIFLHVKEKRFTAGCVSAPQRHVRWLTRWLDPELKPRIVMGPRRWVLRRF